MFSHIFKANPYHDAAGRFATRDGSAFTSIGGIFSNSNARDKAGAFKVANSFKEAATIAKKKGLPVLRENKSDLFKDIMAYQDSKWEKMTEEERNLVYGYREGHLKPSESKLSQKNARWQAKDVYQHEIKYEGKDPFDVADIQKSAIQNMMNYNQSLPKYAKAMKKFGEAPVYPINFGKRTGQMPGASGQYVYGKVFMNTEWISKEEINTDYSMNPGSRTRSRSGSVFLDNGTAGILRHEQAHAIHVDRMDRKKAAEWDALHTQVSGLPAEQNFRNTEMGYDKNTPLKQISSYAQSNSMESFAETFALMTHPSFDRTKYSKKVQPLFDFMDKEVFS